jgi:predicted TIM-barrel fold metal-dependent hydrolase
MRWRLPWDDEDPGLPIKLTPVGNDEYIPAPLSPVAREAVRRARLACEENARRTGMSRRRFLLSACGAATTLLALDACAKEAARHGPTAATSTPGGSFTLPRESTTEPEVATTALGGAETIFDVQGHLLDYTVDPLSKNAPDLLNSLGFPQARCGDANPHDCFSAAHFLELMFLRSDTSMAIISSLPLFPDHSPESIVVRDRVRQVAHALSHDDRLLVHGEAHPTLSPLPLTLEAMAQQVADYPIAAWKVYTHTPGPPWWLDDHEAGVAQVGAAFVAKAVELGVPRICVHKGLVPAPYNDPIDIGPAAKRHPDASFVVYHAGWEQGVPEGPYTPATSGQGVNRLITSLLASGIGPNANVYAEMGTTWFNVLRSPTEAAHVVGKLLKYVGEDNVLWGTDSIWYGSPQDQIQAFRAFQINEEFQSRYGYPALTPELKSKVFGANALRLYGVQPITGHPTYTRADLANIRLDLPGGHVALGPTNARQAAIFAGRGAGLA